MENFKNTQQILTDRYYNEVVKPLLPRAEQGTSYAFGQSIPSQLEISPLPVNGSLLESQYEYSTAPLKFIHYTSSKNAESILSSKKIWMNSLASMNDPQELSHAISTIIPEKSDFTVDNYKKEVFSLSMNEFQTETESENNWIEYGDNGYGVGLVLSFPDGTKNDWNQHYLSKIHYQDEKLDALCQYHIRHTDYISQLPVTIVGQVKHFMLPLAAFHKTNGYKKENEVRFIVVNTSLHDSWDKRIYCIKAHDERTFIELDLDLKFKETYRNTIPIPKIEKIILGPKLIEVAKIKDILRKLALENLGYDVTVEKSKLIV
jgi:hypothetical protein